MAFRKFPYGYTMNSGELDICEDEANNIRRLFTEFLDGKSMYSIALALFNENDPYFNDTKKKAACKVSSILRDKRYSGADGYPAIIDNVTLIPATRNGRSQTNLPTQTRVAAYCRVSTDEEEQQYGAYSEWLNSVGAIVSNDSIMQAWRKDPAGDDYHYFRGSDFDSERKSILDRYKRINNPQGNSPETEDQTESYDTSYKSGPDVEDINQDYTLNEYERYYQYKVRISPEILDAYRKGAAPADCFITDMRTSSVKLRNGDTTSVNWFQFRIPLDRVWEQVPRVVCLRLAL